MNSENNKDKKLIVLAVRITPREFEEFHDWKQSNNLESNTIALRRALAIAINGRGLLNESY